MKYTKIIEFADIRVSLLAVWKNISKCFIFALAFFAIGTILTMSNSVDNIYSASCTLYCPVNGNYSETNSAIQIISSYATLVKSQKVAERAISILGNTELTYKDVQAMTSYSTSNSSINLTIFTTSYDEDEAVQVANAVSNAFVEEMRNMTGMDVVQILSAADKATLAQNGIIELWKRRLSFFVVGFAIMALLIFIYELFSDKVRSIDQCLITEEDAVIGVIPEFDNKNE